MKRLLISAAAFSLVGIALAQSSFTIRRPLDNQTVREVVQVRIPKRSIPSGAGFIGIWVNGRFVEAVAPFEGANTDANDFIYSIDTKARKIPDGQLTIEAVLYVNRGTVTQPINKSSVVVRLDNSSSIRIPANGLRLRYPFVPNSEFIYNVEFKQTMQNMTEAQAQLGSRAGQVESEPQRFRYRIAVMNRYQERDGSRQGLMLMQPLPPRGQDFAMLITAGNTTPQKYYDYTMAPLYVRMTDTGREIFGAWPFYSAGGTSIGSSNRLDLVAMLPLPILPSRGIRPGGSPWPGGLPQAQIDLEKSYENERFTTILPARGTLESIEFERGRPTAKIRTVLAQGNPQTGVLEFEDFYWFDLGLGMPVKMERRTTVTTRVRVQTAGAGGGGRGGAGGGMTRPGGAGADSGDEFGGAAMGRNTGPFIPESGRFSGPGFIMDGETLNQSRALGSEGVDGNGQSPGAGPGRTGGNRGGGNQAQTRLVRQRTVITLTLE